MSGARLLAVLVLLVAAVLRLYGLEDVPPGLEHDEVANWLIDRDLLAGQHGVYFGAAYGHEAGYHYLQAAAVALFGDHALALRLPSVFAGLLGIALSYALARRLFGERVALVNAAVLALLFWQLFYSRLGVRAISLPVVSGLAAWLFWRGVGPGLRDGTGPPHTSGGTDRDRSLARDGTLGLSGLSAGLSLYTYMAARAVPLVFALYVLYLVVFHRPVARRRWRGFVLFFVLMAAVAVPLALWLVAHPGAEFRVSEINQPLDALLEGDLGPTLKNGLRLLGFFGWQGDPLIRQNMPGRPVFDPLSAVLFYGGALLLLWRWRRPEHAFILIWLVVSLTPSLVTADAPSSIRCINGLVVVGIIVGLAIEALALVSRYPSLAVSLTAAWLVASGAWTVRDYFLRWPADSEVQFVWQTALRDAAAALEADPDTGPVAVGGWTPDTMDPPTMDLFLRREDIPLRFFNPTQALILPAGGPSRVVWPSILPLDPALASELGGWGGLVQERDSFVAYRVPAVELGPLSPPRSVDFDGGVTFLGHRPVAEPDGFGMLTYWRAAGPVEEPLRVFVHLLDAAGQVVGQHDGLGAPAAHWGAGDLIVQAHRVEVPPGEYTPRIGLYNPEAGDRRPHSGPGGPADSLLLAMVNVP